MLFQLGAGDAEITDRGNVPPPCPRTPCLSCKTYGRDEIIHGKRRRETRVQNGHLRSSV